MIQIDSELKPPVSLDNPFEHLMACHRRIEQRLDTLQKAAAALENEREQALQAITNAVKFLDNSGHLHTVDEEESLFPRLRPTLSSEEAAVMEKLESDHRETELLFGELKAVSQGLQNGRDLDSTFRELALKLNAAYREHIATEEANIPKLAPRLDEAVRREITQEMRKRRQPGEPL